MSGLTLLSGRQLTNTLPNKPEDENKKSENKKIAKTQYKHEQI